jgi:multidrug resistance protein, MATE family
MPRETATLHPVDPARGWGIGEILRLSVPTVLTTVSFTIMQFVDTLMVSRVGEEAMSAQLTGGMASFTSVCFFIGLLWCVSTFASQNLGAGRPERAALYGWQGLWLSVGAAVLLAPLIPLAPHVVALFGQTPAVQAMEAPYFQLLVGGSVFVLASQALAGFFVGLHKPGVPFIAGVAGNVVNFGAAYSLIFGEFGLPQMGLTGAALGAVIGTGVQATVLAGFFLAGPMSRRFQVWRQCRVAWGPLWELLRLGAPAGLVFAGELLMWTVFMGVIVGSFGLAAQASTNILNRYWQVCFMPAVGVSNAASAIVGRYCGAGQMRLAWRRAHAALILVEVYMVGMGLVEWLARDTLVGFFNSDHNPEVQAVATQTFIFILICQAFDALNVIFIGALRGAGDTLWPSLVQLVLAYGLGIGGSAAVAHWRPEWGVNGPWIMGSAYIAILGLVMWLRFLGGRWKTMAVVQPTTAGGD